MSTIHSIRATAFVLAAVALPTALRAQVPYATTVVASDTNGGAGGGIFNPGNALGAPQGPTHVHSLGNGGFLTLGFAQPIVNAPGADFLVGENAFLLAGSWWQTFAEVMFVEVSSDGVVFARFPARYFGPPVAPGPFGTVPTGTYAGLAGQTPVQLGAADPQDVASAGGDAFDLADLAGDPLVLGSQVDLGAITHVRLVDVQSGIALDSTGVPIFDPGSGSADVDAITVIHPAGTPLANHPNVELTIATDGTITLRLEHPAGWQQLDFTSLRAQLLGIPVDAFGLLGAFSVQTIDATGFTLVQPVPLPGIVFTMAFSLRDLQGNRAGQQRTRPF
jgi:hypothetical protein